jgi:phosphonate transport system permease protein
MERAVIYVKAMGETLAIAFLGTLLAAALAFPLGFLAARNVVANRIVRFLSRRSLDTLRGIDVLVWALIWINVVGLGPFAGVLALMTSDIGSFGKLFSEAIETADRRPVEGVVSTGGGALHRVRFGILPSVLPVMAGQVLYYIESNTRSATIIGIVGAGGIGLHLAEQIRVLEFQQVAFIIVLVLIAVAAIDWISTRLRAGLSGARRAGAA